MESWQWADEQKLNFGGDPGHRSGYESGSVSRH